MSQNKYNRVKGLYSVHIIYSYNILQQGGAPPVMNWLVISYKPINHRQITYKP